MFIFEAVRTARSGMPGLHCGMNSTLEQLFFLTHLGSQTSLAYLEIYIRQLTAAHPEDSICLKHNIHGNLLARRPSPSFTLTQKVWRGRTRTDRSQGAKPESVERMWYHSIHYHIVYEWQIDVCKMFSETKGAQHFSECGHLEQWTFQS